mgnify:FL=1
MKERNIKIGNRISGLAMIAFGSIVSTGNMIPLYIGGGAFIAEGLGDFISGQHHYCSTKAYNFIKNRIKIK